MTLAARLKHAAARALLPEPARVRFRELAFHDAGHGYDAFGFDPASLAVALGLARFWYERYFRVESHGIEQVPRSGAAILAANHSGLLPLDATMIVVDVLRRSDPPRLPRAIGDVFIPFMPWVGTAFSRVGVVAGSRVNFRWLLEHGELVLVFPEGTPGIGKGYQKRYQLQGWRVGHVELALAHRVPVVPVAVVGAEEAWPQLARLERFHAFGAPFLPVPATPLPLPVKLAIHYGAPIDLSARFAGADWDDPAVAAEGARLVKEAVAGLIEQGRRERRGFFG